MTYAGVGRPSIYGRKDEEGGRPMMTDASRMESDQELRFDTTILPRGWDSAGRLRLRERRM